MCVCVGQYGGVFCVSRKQQQILQFFYLILKKRSKQLTVLSVAVCIDWWGREKSETERERYRERQECRVRA